MLGLPNVPSNVRHSIMRFSDLRGLQELLLHNQDKLGRFHVKYLLPIKGLNLKVLCFWRMGNFFERCHVLQGQQE